MCAKLLGLVMCLYWRRDLHSYLFICVLLQIKIKGLKYFLFNILNRVPA